MSQWPSTKARLVLAALLRIGWTIKRQSGTSHRVLTRPGWANVTFAFHDRMDYDNISARRDDVLYPVAADMAKRGATRGMILLKLREQKLDEFTAGLVADRALRAVAGRKWIAGLGLVAAGIAILVAACCSAWLFRAKIPIALGMFGLIVMGLGISQVAHRTTLPKDPPGSISRVR